MSSTRLILIFLGIILLVIIILSSTRISQFLRTRFPQIIPTNIKSYSTTTPATPTLSPTPSPIVGKLNQISPTPSPIRKSTPSSQIPATGPQEIVWLVISAGMAAGATLRKISAGKK